jgi:Sporulation and spore germination
MIAAPRPVLSKRPAGQRYCAPSVDKVPGEGTGKPILLSGNARLDVRFWDARGHTDSGHLSYGPARRALALPNLIQVASAGDFEAHLGFGVGVARKTHVTVFTLKDPSRVVIDIATPFKTVPVKVYLFKASAFSQNHEPFVRPVRRPVISPAVATGALQRMFAGPTVADMSNGLSLLRSEATGIRLRSIRDGVARVQLTGGCNARGSTATIAMEIMPTLKQFRSVRCVKIYDPAGHTGEPHGHSDSIPDCLNP